MQIYDVRVPFSIVICGFFSIIWISQFNVNSHIEYRMVVVMYGLAAVIELASEPMWLYGQMNLMVTLRVVIEASALLSRTVLSTFLYFMWPNMGLYAFGIAQMAYSMFVTFGYFGYFYWFFGRDRYRTTLLCDSIVSYRQIFPCLSRFEIEPIQFKMVSGFVLNCVLKQALTEGERYLMTISNWVSLEMQGEFDVISNLGSLAPRLVFISIEDSCHLAFSKMLKQGFTGKDQDKVNLDQSFKMLTVTLKIVILLGITILVFAQAYSWPLLVLYAGSDKATAGTPLLRVFALYVLLLAVNGVTECFYYSVISQRELNWHTYRLVGFSIVFVMCGAGFVSLFGTVGVIWANCVNMLLRIFTSTRFMWLFYQDTDYSLSSVYQSSCPGLVVLAAYLCSLLVTLASLHYFETSFVDQLCHVSVGVVTVLLVLALVLRRELALLTFLRDKIKIS